MCNDPDCQKLLLDHARERELMKVEHAGWIRSFDKACAERDAALRDLAEEREANAKLHREWETYQRVAGANIIQAREARVEVSKLRADLDAALAELARVKAMQPGSPEREADLIKQRNDLWELGRKTEADLDAARRRLGEAGRLLQWGDYLVTLTNEALEEDPDGWDEVSTGHEKWREAVAQFLAGTTPPAPVQAETRMQCPMCFELLSEGHNCRSAAAPVRDGAREPKPGETWREKRYGEDHVFTGRRMPRDAKFWECINAAGTVIEGFADSCFVDGTLAPVPPSPHLDSAPPKEGPSK